MSNKRVVTMRVPLNSLYRGSLFLWYGRAYGVVTRVNGNFSVVRSLMTGEEEWVGGTALVVIQTTRNVT